MKEYDFTGYTYKSYYDIRSILCEEYEGALDQKEYKCRLFSENIDPNTMDVPSYSEGTHDVHNIRMRNIGAMDSIDSKRFLLNFGQDRTCTIEGYRRDIGWNKVREKLLKCV